MNDNYLSMNHKFIYTNNILQRMSRMEDCITITKELKWNECLKIHYVNPVHRSTSWELSPENFLVHLRTILERSGNLCDTLQWFWISMVIFYLFRHYTNSGSIKGFEKGRWSFMVYVTATAKRAQIAGRRPKPSLVTEK